MSRDFRFNLLLTSLALALSSSLSAATITVPTQQPTIAAAITAANTGDEIRVRRDFIEASSSNAISGKALTIRSYDLTYTTPESGAQWVLATGGGGASGGLILLQSGATLTFEGFSQVTVPGGNAFLVGASCGLTVNQCTFSGIVLSNTAAVKADTVSTVNVTLNNCAFNSNGRSIWYNNVTGTNSLTVNQATFFSNSSYPIEFRTMAGSHSLNMTGCSVTQATNAPTRLYFFGTTGGALTNNTVNIDRCSFTITGTGGTPIVVGGISDTASASSTANITATNCLIDIRGASASAAGIGALADTANRKSNVTLRHCTVVLGNAGQAGMYQYSSTYPGAWTMENSITDGPGYGFKNDGPGTMTSGKNLLNTAAGITTGTGTATIALSGTEITGVSPAFVSAASGNFRLAPSSPAVDAAVSSAVAIDLEGNARPIGAASDLGAYERLLITAAESWQHYF